MFKNNQRLEFYFKLFSLLPTPVLVFEEQDLKIIDANDTALNFYGYTRDEILRLNMLDISVETEETKRAVKQTVGGALSHIPIRYHRKKNGSIVAVEVVPTLVKYENRNVLCGVIRDISNRLHMEESLRNSERKYATLLSNLPGMAYRCMNDKHRTMEFISEGCFDLTGFSPAVFLNNNMKSYNVIVYPEDQDRVLRTIQEAIKKKQSYEMIYRIITSTGHTKYVWEQGVGIYDDNGTLLFLEGFITNVTEQKRYEFELKKENLCLRTTVRRSNRFGDIIGNSKVMLDVYDHLLKASMSDVNVILYGESGTGKELAARAIHELSERKNQPFITVNCGAIPHDLIESEFFGYKKGAFTNAVIDKMGFLDCAEGGTLFLDEVGEISQSMQVKLLRALDDGGYTPVGGTTTKYPDVRVISATNKNLKTLLTQGGIREDFFYRIHVLSVKMPPLRERHGDIQLLANHFVQHYSNGTVYSLPLSVLNILANHHWQGNVRELKNTIMRFLALKSETLDEKHNITSVLELNTTLEAATDNWPLQLKHHLDLSEAVEKYEKAYIQKVLESQRWHRGKAADILGIHQKTLSRKIKKHELA